MLLCHHLTTLQPVTDFYENVDWTNSAQFYGNLGEIPSFISTQRQSFTQQPYNSIANPALLQGKQLQVYQAVLQEFSISSSHDCWNRKIVYY